MMVESSTVLPFYQIVILYLLLLESIIEKNSMAANIKEAGNYLEESFFNPNVLTTQGPWGSLVDPSSFGS